MGFTVSGLRGGLAITAMAGLLWLPRAKAVTCKTESQMTSAERDALAGAARGIVSKVQTGDVQGIRAQTIPAVAAQFGAIAAAADRLKPLLQNATITVDDLYAMDASSEKPGTPRTEFFCGTPVVTLTFHNLPPGKYGLTIVHATGVPKPQQISLVLSETPAKGWMLAGFVNRPMTLAGHNGIWYWEQARKYAQQKKNWNAWLYYQTAATLLNPASFLSSPNFQKLQKEMDAARPAELPGARPMVLHANGSAFSVGSVGTTTEFGGLDLEVNYEPDAAQRAQLQDPVAARNQAIAVMRAMLESYPGLRSAFRGIWVRAHQGSSTVFALDLPMDQISKQQ